MAEIVSKNKFKIVVFISMLTILLIISFTVQLAADGPELVYRIPVTGNIDNGLFRFVERGVAAAEGDGADLIVFEIDTYGGYVDPAIKIRDLILSTELPTVTFVSGRAWSAGALIALAGEELFMVPGSSMGAAETRPDDEKYISALRKEFKATAETRGKNSELAVAMVDADLEIEGMIVSGKLLTLTAREAVDNNMADDMVAAIPTLFEKLEGQPGQIVEIDMTLAEKAARYINT
ncbi:MAG: ATP-dependent Clp protease proteolytic subunit, partial [Halanaerobiaceae bacterium]